MKVLIAEDSVALQKLLQDVLKEWGYEALPVSDGREAFERLKSADAPRLAILDWMMPGLDGPDVCRRIRKLDTLVPTYIILLTTRGRKEDIVAGLECGADDYVTKPFDHNELRARLNVGRKMVQLYESLADRLQEIQEAIAHIKKLQGLIPICMHCHKIRDDQQGWQRLEAYIHEHSDAEFSHGICPECRDKHFPRGKGLRRRNG